MSDNGEMLRERLSFWALILITAALGIAISAIGLWVPGQGAIMQAPPNQGESFALVLTNGLMGVAQALGIVALFSRRVRFWPTLILTLLIFPTSYIVPAVDAISGQTNGFVRDLDDVIRFGSLLVMGLLLLFPWVSRQMAWPHRTAGHLAAGIALLSILALQTVFHVGLIWSGWGFRDAKIASTKTVIESTLSSEELRRLGELDMLPLVPVTKDNLSQFMAQERAAAAESKKAGLHQLWEDAPKSLFVWPMHGYSERETFFIIYDGRAEPATWGISASYFNERRLYSVATMFYLSGVSMAVWCIMALVVARAHLLRQQGSARSPAARTATEGSGASRARAALVSIGALGISATLLVNRLDLAVASYLVILSSAACLFAGLNGRMWRRRSVRSDET